MLSAAGLEAGLRHGGYSQLGFSQKDTPHLDVAAFLTRAYWVSQSSEGEPGEAAATWPGVGPT